MAGYVSPDSTNNGKYNDACAAFIDMIRHRVRECLYEVSRCQLNRCYDNDYIFGFIELFGNN